MSRNAIQPWMRGDCAPVMTIAVPTGTDIEIGNLTGVDGSNLPFPASAQTWDTSLAVTQAAFALLFLGVAAQRSRVGDIQPIRVNQRGVHVFNCASATFKQGDLVGPAKAAGNAILSDTVVAVSDVAHAIGRVAANYVNATTEVEVEVWGQVGQGGVPS